MARAGSAKLERAMRRLCGVRLPSIIRRRRSRSSAAGIDPSRLRVCVAGAEMLCIKMTGTAVYTATQPNESP
jgi:hypothetical protein